MPMKTLSIFFFSIFVACSGSDSDGDTSRSGIVADKSVTALTDQEVSQLCDWSVSTQGGPGHVTICSAESSRETDTKDECIEELSALRKLPLACTITVRDAEDCSIESHKDPCARNKPACKRIGACIEDAQNK